MKPTFFNETLFQDFSAFIEQQNYTKIIFLVDENTHEHCLPLVLGELETQTQIEIIEIQSGEAHKTLETCYQVWMALTELKADRNSILLNVGGGVITDLGAFVASTYLRGIDFVHFPTTLLSMVDASIGGKTGVDLEGLKNRIGTFSMPKNIYIIPEFLHTLADQEVKSGFAEMLKHALILDNSLFKTMVELPEISTQNVLPLVENSTQIKYKIVTQDPTEKGIRKILNFGHTIGHAIETHLLRTSKPIPHGFAVAIGMYYETKLSYQKNILKKEECELILHTISKWYSIPNYSESEINTFIQLMYSDKKNTGNKVNFTLLENIGNATYNHTVEEKEILKAMLNN